MDRHAPWDAEHRSFQPSPHEQSNLQLSPTPATTSLLGSLLPTFSNAPWAKGAACTARWTCAEDHEAGCMQALRTRSTVTNNVETE